jgi:hypothetical protein
MSLIRPGRITNGIDVLEAQGSVPVRIGARSGFASN